MEANLPDDGDKEVYFRTRERYAKIDCERCGEQFLTKDEYEANGIEPFKCKYCSGLAAFNYAYELLPVNNKPDFDPTATNFTDFIKSGVVHPRLKACLENNHKLIQFIYGEIVEKLMGRKPTPQEVTSYGKSVINNEQLLAGFYWKNMLMFRVAPLENVNSLYDGKAIQIAIYL